MTKTDYRKELLLLALLVAPLVYLGLIWQSLPDVFPAALNDTVQQQIQTKSDFLLLMIFVFLTNGLLYALFRYLPRTDGDQVSDPGVMHQEYYRVRFVMQLALTAMSCLIILMVQTGHYYAMERWAFIGIGLVITGIGLYLRNLQPNNYVGIRTPWTLRSAEIWKETHRFASILWTAAGIVFIAGAFFMSLITGIFVIFAASMILPVLPYIYSFRQYNQDQG
ncbi:SdpI family protein [Chitinophaga sp. sic0106]|uniref:SdpI family protein n=1 Tax=Chitinophaga sp. sic0106 TaxID=2854785 RepID=UPI001C482630|nr:SdpI family protein [Chitinophaga sp. sic0106]MBV7531776.1 SdpI family protein [Chitinophaga sp. sic0106]